MQDFIRILLLRKFQVQIKDINQDEQVMFDELAKLLVKINLCISFPILLPVKQI